jgi:hypothetical protein
LEENQGSKGEVKKKPSPKFSPEARVRIAEAQRKRWAEIKAGIKRPTFEEQREEDQKNRKLRELIRQQAELGKTPDWLQAKLKPLIRAAKAERKRAGRAKIRALKKK